jgi:hypothetical protein
MVSAAQLEDVLDRTKHGHRGLGGHRPTGRRRTKRFSRGAGSCRASVARSRRAGRCLSAYVSPTRRNPKSAARSSTCSRIRKDFRQRPEEARGPSPLQRFPNRRTRHAVPAGDLMRRYGRRLQPNNLACIAHSNPLRRHRSLPDLPKGRPDQANGGARQSGNHPGRDHSVMGGEIISEPGGGINPVTGGRNHLGIGGRLPPESAHSPLMF